MTEGGWLAAAFPSAGFLSSKSRSEEVNRLAAKARLIPRGGKEEGGVRGPAHSSLHRCARRERGPGRTGTPGSHAGQKRRNPKDRFSDTPPPYGDRLAARLPGSGWGWGGGWGAPHWRSQAREVNPGDSRSRARDASAEVTTAATSGAAGVNLS